MTRSRGVKIVLVDACRNNPFRPNMNRAVATRSLGRGLARVDPIGGVLVGDAAREGTLALDGDGRNSPFALALLEYLEQPGLEIGKLFRKVRDSVYAMTDGQQEPFTYGSLPGSDIYLSPPVALAALPVPQHTSVDPDLVGDFARAENSGTLGSWVRFLNRHGADADNPLVALALQRQKRLLDQDAANNTQAAREPWLKPAAGLKKNPIPLTRDERKLVQKALNYMGFDPGPIDGQFGPKTRSAISAARYQAGLFPGDRIDAALLRALPNVPVIDGLKQERAVPYFTKDLPSDLEPRLAKALRAMWSRHLIFGYFEGHLYLAVLGGFDSWASINNRARQAGGHLVTIDSAEENRFVYKLFSQDSRFIREFSKNYQHGPMIGLFQIDRSREPGGGWVWVTGEPVSYTNWSRGNPDNTRGRQHFASFYRSARDRNSLDGPIRWDDVSGITTGYIIEIE